MIAIGIIILLIIGCVVAWAVYKEYYKTATIIGIVGAFISITCILIGTQSNSFDRFIKDVKSDYSDGLTRTITIQAEDGRTIYTYSGTIDIELDGEQRKIKFEDEKGKRQIIFYGIQDTVMIIEQ